MRPRHSTCPRLTTSERIVRVRHPGPNDGLSQCTRPRRLGRVSKTDPGTFARSSATPWPATSAPPRTSASPRVCKVRCLPCSATTSTLELRSGKERAHRQTLRPVISRSACPARSSASATVAPRSRRATGTRPAMSYNSFSRSAPLRRLDCAPAPPYAPRARSTADPSPMLRRFEPSHVSLTVRPPPAVTETETT
jgi:hypothetical protein